ncbi:MAG: tetratricopeptide repeat protein, partial [Bradyrhizobium sp.]|nr:tetratricopeptide repeat protein [Bradyrhizobium sp.]
MEPKIAAAQAQFLPMAEALSLAERYRQQGRLAEAEALCRQMIEADPKLHEAQHLLGVIAHQGGRLTDAVQHTERAVKVAPDVALYH